MDFLNVNDTMECLHISINIFSVKWPTVLLLFIFIRHFMTFLKIPIYGKNVEGGGAEVGKMLGD